MTPRDYLLRPLSDDHAARGRSDVVRYLAAAASLGVALDDINRDLDADHPVPREILPAAIASAVDRIYLHADDERRAAEHHRETHHRDASRAANSAADLYLHLATALRRAATLARLDLPETTL